MAIKTGLTALVLREGVFYKYKEINPDDSVKATPIRAVAVGYPVIYNLPHNCPRNRVETEIAELAKLYKVKDANAKDANAKDANAKDANAKDANAKDANAKDANAKDANAYVLGLPLGQQCVDGHFQVPIQFYHKL